MGDDFNIHPVPASQLGDRKRPQKEILLRVVCIISLVIFMAKAVTSMVQKSATWDETHYFGLGKYLILNQRWDVPGSILHPPLAYYVNGVPLLFFDTEDHAWQNNPARTKDISYLHSHDVRRGRLLLSSPANRDDRLLILSRLMSVLAAVWMGWHVYLWSKAIHGKWGAVCAMVLFSFSPKILADARLITPDICLTTFVFITVYYLWRFLGEGKMRDALLGGLNLGLALLSKYTALLLPPICVVLMILWRVKRRTLNLRGCILFLAVGAGVLLAGYGLDLWPYHAGLWYQWNHARTGQNGFLMGECSTQGWWYFYVVAFLIKTPITTLILLAISLAVFLARTAKGDWINQAFLLVPAAVFFGFFSVYHSLAIGLRYILPIYPFLFVFAGEAVSFLLLKKSLTAILLALMSWYVVTSSWIHPHYLAYFNELVGGPANGHKYLVDSNLDWGQDLKGLRKFMDQHKIQRISFSYFGEDSPKRYGITYDWLPSFDLANPTPGQRTVRLRRWVAISATNLRGVYFTNHNVFAPFRRLKPYANVGYSILIYKLNDAAPKDGRKPR